MTSKPFLSGVKVTPKPFLSGVGRARVTATVTVTAWTAFSVAATTVGMKTSTMVRQRESLQPGTTAALVVQLTSLTLWDVNENFTGEFSKFSEFM